MQYLHNATLDCATVKSATTTNSAASKSATANSEALMRNTK